MFSKTILLLVSFPLSVSFASFHLTWLFLSFFLCVWTWDYTEKYCEPQTSPMSSLRILQTAKQGVPRLTELSPSSPWLSSSYVLQFPQDSASIKDYWYSLKISPHLRPFLASFLTPFCLRACTEIAKGRVLFPYQGHTGCCFLGLHSPTLKPSLSLQSTYVSTLSYIRCTWKEGCFISLFSWWLFQHWMALSCSASIFLYFFCDVAFGIWLK